MKRVFFFIMLIVLAFPCCKNEKRGKYIGTVHNRYTINKQTLNYDLKSDTTWVFLSEITSFNAISDLKAFKLLSKDTCLLIWNDTSRILLFKGISE